MILPLQIEFHNTQPIEDVEFHIRRELADLEKFYNGLVSCRVDVEVPEHARKGSVSEIRIDFGVPAKDVALEARRYRSQAGHRAFGSEGAAQRRLDGGSRGL